MKPPTNKQEALDVLSSLEEDFILLQDGDWIPDNHSCEASRDNIRLLVDYVLALPNNGFVEVNQ